MNEIDGGYVNPQKRDSPICTSSIVYSSYIHLFIQQAFMRHLTTTKTWAYRGKLMKECRNERKEKKKDQGTIILQFSINFFQSSGE